MTERIKVNSSSISPIKAVIFFVILIFVYDSLTAQVVKGRVIDKTTEEPVKDALVFIMAKKDRISDMQISDSLGFFCFNNVSYKRFYIKTNRLGYDDFIFGKLIIPESDTLSLIINLEPAPFVLKDIPVVAEKPDHDKGLDAVGYYTRKASGNGKFITREEIKDRHVSRTTDLMLSVPGVILNKGIAYSTRAYQSTGTPMRVFIDGMLVDEPNIPEPAGSNSKYREALSPLNMVPPSLIKAIEVYPNSNDAPLQYSWGRYGGVILIWTGK